MGAAILGLRLLLAGVFGLAALGKLINRPGFAVALSEFAVPRWLIGPAVAGLPVLELGVAVALVSPVTSWWAACVSVLMLGCFTAIVGVALHRGRSPDCACFGGLRSAPIGPNTVVRNAMLGLVAAAVVAAGPASQGPDPLRGLSSVSGSAAIEASLAAGLFIVFACGGWLFTQMLAQNGRLLARVEALEHRLSPSGDGPTARPVDTYSGLPVGIPAPRFTLGNVDGRLVSLEELCGLGRPVLLVFSDPGCGPCGALLPDLARWQQSHPIDVTITVVSRGAAAAHLDSGLNALLPYLLLQRDREVAHAYGAYATPSAVLVAPDATVASQLTAGAVAVSALVARTVSQPHPDAANSVDLPSTMAGRD